MALEIIQAFADWYPVDFFTDQSSRYTQYYKKLKSLKVGFPELKEHEMVKYSEKDLFKKNYEKWMKKMNEDDAEEEKKKSLEKQKIEEQKKKN